MFAREAANVLVVWVLGILAESEVGGYVSRLCRGLLWGRDEKVKRIGLRPFPTALQHFLAYTMALALKNKWRFLKYLTTNMNEPRIRRMRMPQSCGPRPSDVSPEG